jgi:ferredoxin-NADP reductase
MIKEAIGEESKLTDFVAFVCGPELFMQTTFHFLQQLNYPLSSVQQERFDF